MACPISDVTIGESSSISTPESCSSQSGSASPSKADRSKARPDDEAIGHTEVLQHPSLPYSYRITKFNELYHVAERLGRSQQNESWSQWLKLYKKKLALYYRLFPLAVRFSRQTIIPLGKRRLLLYFLANIILKLIPSYQWEATWRLGELTRSALQTGSVDKRAFANNIFVEAASYLLQRMLEGPINDNRALLQYRFRALIKSHIMRARVRLDAVTCKDDKVIGKLRSVETLSSYDWTGSFLLEHVAKITSLVIATISEARTIYKLSEQSTSRVAAIGIVASLVNTVRDNLWYKGDWKFEYALSNTTHWRMRTMETLATQAGAQDQILNLKEYYVKEYEKAAALLGEVREQPPNVYSREYGGVWYERMWEVSRRAVDSSLYLVFALHMARRNGAADPMAATKAMSDFELLKQSVSCFSDNVLSTFSAFQDAGDVFRPIRDFYALPDIKSNLAICEKPKTYADSKAKSVAKPEQPTLEYQASQSTEEQASPMSCDTPEKTKQGMVIEFDKVSYTYPGSRRKALDCVSFKIEAGELVSIVGFSGSGKSTLVSLLVRLHDPDEGRILVNGMDIKEIDPSDLYRHLSMLFQSTDRLQLTIREFIALGDVTALEDDKRLRAAAEASGALEIIERTKKGFDTDLSMQRMWNVDVSKQTLLKRVCMLDDWKEEDLNAEDDEEDRDDVEDADKKEPESDVTNDSDTLKLLRSFHYAPIDPRILEKSARLASSVRLPKAPQDEAVVLANDYEASKVDEDYEDEVRFSGGEWSKIALARSFLRKEVDLIILDEFSAALDVKSEAEIFQKLTARRGLQTIVAITHRLHLAVRSDKIIFMKNGKVVECGSHAELMKNDGEYREMYECSVSSSGVEISTQTCEEDWQTPTSRETAPESVVQAAPESGPQLQPSAPCVFGPVPFVPQRRLSISYSSTRHTPDCDEAGPSDETDDSSSESAPVTPPDTSIGMTVFPFPKMTLPEHTASRSSSFIDAAVQVDSA